MKVVIDTNVLVSAFLSPCGAPAEIVRMAVEGDLRICYDMRILNEYRGVLGRAKFNIPSRLSTKLLEQICVLGESAITLSLISNLPDQSDEAFLEVALAAQAACLITDNLKHFPPSCRQGMRVASPAEFLEFYWDRPDLQGGSVKTSREEYRVREVDAMAWTSAEVDQVIQSIRHETRTGDFKRIGTKTRKTAHPIKHRAIIKGKK